MPPLINRPAGKRVENNGHEKIDRATGGKTSPVRRLMGVQIVSTGGFVPETVVRNEDLARLGYDADWILQRTGIRERRRAGPELATSDMAVEAAKRCIARVGAAAADIDLVIVATFTSDEPVPATACLVQDRLGLNAAAMDIQNGCSGFLYAFVTGMQYVATGCSRLALIVGADCNSRIVNPQDMKTYPLFGDGAGAVLLARGSAEQGLLAYTLGSEGSGAQMLIRPMGGSRMLPSAEGFAANLHFLRMDGRGVFKWAIRLVEESTRAVTAHAGMAIDDIDLVVLHQANIRILDAAAEQLGIPRSKMVVNLDRYGNTSAASVPLALDEALDAGRIHPGSRVLISGFGAGLAWGTGILGW
jgi:3-oxoacyl-[acyl-carrier-protein] synthase III